MQDDLGPGCTAAVDTGSGCLQGPHPDGLGDSAGVAGPAGVLVGTSIFFGLEAVRFGVGRFAGCKWVSVVTPLLPRWALRQAPGVHSGEYPIA